MVTSLPVTLVLSSKSQILISLTLTSTFSVDRIFKYNFDVKVHKVFEYILLVVYLINFSEGNGLLPYSRFSLTKEKKKNVQYQ